MAKNQSESEDVTRGNWNIAGSYTKELILKWLIKIDDYRTLSIFGYSDLYSDVFMSDENLKNTARINSLKRLIESIISLLRTTRFAVGKQKDDKTTFDDYRDRLKKIKSHVNRLRMERKRGNKIIELNIDENLFSKMMDDIDEKLDDINYRLNVNKLIFSPEDEVDIDKIKESYKQRFVQRK